MFISSAGKLKRHSWYENWRFRLVRISKTSNVRSDVKIKSSIAEIVMKRKRNVFYMAKLYGFKLRNFITRHLDKVLPKAERTPGIKWAPLKIPMSRRLETLAIFGVTFCSAVLPTFSYVLFYYLLYSQLWWVGLIYLFYILNDHDVASHGGRRWEAFRNLGIHRYVARYFPVRLVKTAELDPSKNYIAPTCPHGQIMIGAITCFATNGADFPSKFPGIKSYVGMVPGRFKAPFLREINLFAGGVSVSEESVVHLMDRRQRGNFLCVNLGGSAEAMESRHDVYKVLVKNRKGYARVAIQTGASVVPVFCFGETRAFNTDPFPKGTWLRDLQDKVRSVTGIAPIAVRGRGFFQYSFGIIAFRTPITVVVGEPIEVIQNQSPTREEIDTLHNKYMEKLVELFEKHKRDYEPDPTIKLVLI